MKYKKAAQVTVSQLKMARRYLTTAKISLCQKRLNIFTLITAYTPNIILRWDSSQGAVREVVDFVLLQKKEGRCSQQVADLSEFWRGQKEIKLLDPNILACKDHEKLLQQLADSKAKVDINQGIDIRLTNPDNIKLLNQIKMPMIHFAWDNPNDDLTEDFKRYAELTTIKSDRNKIVYVLTNFNSTLEQDLYRIYTLRDLGYSPYVMIYQKNTADKQVKHLARWVNNRFIFRSCEKFEDYKA